MLNSFVQKKKIVYDKIEIKKMHSCVYLGQKILLENSIVNEVNRWIKKWCCFEKISIILKSKHALLKRKMFNKNILLAPTHGWKHEC